MESVSIVVTSYTTDRFQDLTELIESVESQIVPAELILVIERDDELRGKIASYLSTSGSNCNLLFSKMRLGISNARNIGIEKSTGSLIAFVDDDTVLSRNWTQEVIAVFKKHPNVIGLTGAVLPKWTDISLSWFPNSLYWMIGCTDWQRNFKEELGYGVSGANMVFKREVFQQVRFTDGFADGVSEEGKLGLTGDDVDFAYRLTSATGKKIIYSPNVVVYHKVYPYKITPRYVRRYAFWQAMTEANYNHLYGSRSRRESRERAFTKLISDIFRSRKNFSKRMILLLNFLIFASLGFLAYRDPALRNYVRTRL